MRERSPSGRDERRDIVLLAVDKFKGCLTADEVAAAIGRGMRAAMPALDVRTVPVADGGEGTVDVALAAGFDARLAHVSGPHGEPAEARWAQRGTRAVLELAAASGLHLVSGEHQAERASTFGTGLLVAAALDAGCTEVIVGLGGSATTDGGAGLLQALGARLTTHEGRVADPGVAVSDVVAVDLDGLRPDLAGCDLRVVCDVDNPLTGPDGAAAVFGPQKGLTPADVRRVDLALARWADLLDDATGTRHRDTPGAGSAGGAGFACVAALAADVIRGVELVATLYDLHGMLPEVDLVVTGEGSLDRQTLRGKAPVGIARLAQRAGTPVVAVCGRSLLSPDEWRPAGFAAVHTVSELARSEQDSLDQAAELLTVVGRRVVDQDLAALRTDR
ncbi:glycerate kinase [uncultured Jatrophihabitans sp.]|uniref:glycerate kinase n=1 Tax=uncultured Jatrophihabitans sp. TaxID=1610747 RepID=UPI0035CACB0B